jgi:outer membrane protein TolC
VRFADRSKAAWSRTAWPSNAWRSRWCPTILILLAVAAAPARMPAQVSLSTVVALAQRNSSGVKLAEADLQKAQGALSESKDAFMPNIEFEFGLPVFPDVGFTGGVPSIFSGTVQSLVFSLPQNQYIHAARFGLTAATLRLKDAREQAALDAAIAYVELDTIDSELDSAHQQESYASRLVDIEQERAEAGVDPLSDALQARLTAAQLKLARLRLEARTANLMEQLAVLTGLPVGSITPDHASIPEVPAVKADQPVRGTAAMESARMLAISKQRVAHGDFLNEYAPQASFNALYSRSTTILNDFDLYYNPQHPIPTNNFFSGLSIQFPLLDLARHAKAKQSAADALRATVEAEQAQQQNDIQIASLTGNLRELDALAEVASLKQQIADEQLKSVLAQLEVGNGASGGPNAPPQLSPKAEQMARIDERQKFEESLDAGLDLAKARLSLLRALGHMQDWLDELKARSEPNGK